MQVKTLAIEWLRLSEVFHEVMPIPATAEKAMRAVFYCGALALLDCVDAGDATVRIDDLLAKLKRFVVEHDV